MFVYTNNFTRHPGQSAESKLQEGKFRNVLKT